MRQTKEWRAGYNAYLAGEPIWKLPFHLQEKNRALKEDRWSAGWAEACRDMRLEVYRSASWVVPPVPRGNTLPGMIPTLYEAMNKASRDTAREFGDPSTIKRMD